MTSSTVDLCSLINGSLRVQKFLKLQVFPGGYPQPLLMEPSTPSHKVSATWA